MCICACIFLRMNEWIGGWKDGLMDGWIYELIDGWMEVCKYCDVLYCTVLSCNTGSVLYCSVTYMT